MANPLAELRTDKLLLAKVENQRPASGAAVTLFEANGPGNVVSLWMALGGGNVPALDGRLRVFYDNATSPAIDIDMGTLLATHFGAGSYAGSHSTPHVHVEINGNNYNTGFLVTFPMPFGSHIRIDYYCPQTSQLPWVYSMVAYSLTSTDEANGMRLRCSGARWADQHVTRQPGDSTVLADIKGGPGWIVWHSQVGGVDASAITPNPSDGNNDSWMERNFSALVDGEATPSIVATGTEDWYDSAWYFEGWKDYGTSVHSYVGTDKPADHPHAVGMATDLWSKWGGIPFQQSALMKADTEAACTTGDRFCWCVLYYQ